MQQHADDHRGYEPQRLARSDAQSGQGGARTVAGDPPADAKYCSAPQQATVYVAEVG